MTAWVLVLWITGGAMGTSPAITTIDMNSREACVAALSQLGGYCVNRTDGSVVRKPR